jgi:type IV secretory pathway VirB10-like protein
MNGIRNTDRYFQPMDPQTEQQLITAQQQASQQPPQPDPQTQAFLQVETMKAQQKGQADMAKLQLQQQSDMVKMQMQAAESAARDDRERDRMDMELVLRAADLLGKYGVAVDQNRIRALQAAPRGPEGV